MIAERRLKSRAAGEGGVGGGVGGGGGGGGVGEPIFITLTDTLWTQVLKKISICSQHENCQISLKIVSIQGLKQFLIWSQTCLKIWDNFETWKGLP